MKRKKMNFGKNEFWEKKNQEITLSCLCEICFGGVDGILDVNKSTNFPSKRGFGFGFSVQK